MKIAIVASTAERLESISGLVRTHLPEDQFVLLQRAGEDLGLNRLDVVSTGIVILDGVMPDPSALRVISECTKERSNPAFVYLLQNYEVEAMASLMHAGVSDAIPIDAVQTELLPAIERIRHRRYLTSSYQPRGKVLTFIACKGGVGSTFLAVNLAYLLAERFDKRVLFVDLHLQDGDAAFYLLDKPRTETLGDIIRQGGLDSTVIASAAVKVTDRLFLLQAPDSPEKSTGITDQHVDNLISVAVQDYDYVIVDIPHTLDSVNMRALDRAETIFLVMQPLMHYLRAVVRQLRTFSMLGYPKERVQVILNRMDRSIDLTVAQMTDVIGHPIEYIVPNDFQNAVESVNLGVPLAKFDEASSVTRALAALAGKITGQATQAADVSWLDRACHWWRSR